MTRFLDYLLWGFFAAVVLGVVAIFIQVAWEMIRFNRPSPPRPRRARGNASNDETWSLGALGTTDASSSSFESAGFDASSSSDSGSSDTGGGDSGGGDFSAGGGDSGGGGASGGW